MTEKQFYIDTIDGGGSVLTVNGVELGLHETCDLLNELYEKDKDGEECYRKLLEKYDTLKEENEQLKFQLDECRNNKLFSRRELEKENERL